MKIGIDIDGVLSDFDNAYVRVFGKTDDQTITNNVNNVLVNDRKFWLTISVKHTLNFTPTLYCSKRVNKKCWTKEWLERNKFPKAPLYQVFKGEKSPRIKGRVDVFIDDSVRNFVEMNLNGVPCLLFATEANRPWGNIGRLTSLDYYDIINEYNNLMNYYYPIFDRIVKRKDISNLY